MRSKYYSTSKKFLDKYRSDNIIDEKVNIILSKKDLYFNFDNWKNRLYIIGLSASGKSTLAYELSNSMNAKYINLDILYEKIFIKSYGNNIYEKYRNVNLFDEKSENNKKLLNIGNKVFEKTRDYISNIRNKKCIIEGVHITYFKPREKFFKDDDAVIVKHTSLLKSFYRRIRREKLRLNLDGLKYYTHGLRWSFVDLKSTNNLVNYLNSVYNMRTYKGEK